MSADIKNTENFLAFIFFAKFAFVNNLGNGEIDKKAMFYRVET